jgi:hypothetical protein
MEDPAKDIILNNCQICGVVFSKFDGYITTDEFQKFCVKCWVGYYDAC